MKSAASRLALLLDCPSVISVLQNGEDIDVRVRSGTFASDIPTSWGGCRVRVYTEATPPEGMFVKSLAVILMAVLAGIVVIGILALVLLVAARC